MQEQSLQQQINEQLFGKLQLAYFCVDSSMKVTGSSNNLASYGYDSVVLGAEIEECVDFMIGLDVDTELDFPMVESPAGIPIAVALLPTEGQLTVLISNASRHAEQRQLLQQKANENELLLERQKKLMAQLEQASKELEVKNLQLEEASRLQTSFLSGVSHEFRTPLTSIIGYTNLVREDLQQASESVQVKLNSQHLRAVQRSSKHLLSLVENLLDHGKLDSNEIVVRPKATDLNEVFDDVILLLKPLSDAKHIQFNNDVQLTKSAIAVMDDSRLRQCLINLIGNAIKFTDEGSVSMVAQLVDESLKISVVDTGPGISDEDLEKIRLPFWQAADTGKAGTGLGLTITERIIELMGGELEIASELGTGTTVSFEIPAPTLLEESVGDVSTASKVSGKKVLLAEDDIDIADLVVLMMSEYGVEVNHVENGALAIEAMNRHDYDLALMDINMPIMTGYEALEKLQASNNTTPIIIMSASAIEADREKAENLGCYDYLVKPVDISDILQIMDSIID